MKKKYNKPKIRIKKINTFSFFRKLDFSMLEDQLFAAQCHYCPGYGGSV